MPSWRTASTMTGMWRRFLGWFYGWRETLIIKYRHPELYRQMLEPVEFPGDFGEVRPPE